MVLPTCGTSGPLDGLGQEPEGSGHLLAADPPGREQPHQPVGVVGEEAGLARRDRLVEMLQVPGGVAGGVLTSPRAVAIGQLGPGFVAPPDAMSRRLAAEGPEHGAAKSRGGQGAFPADQVTHRGVLQDRTRDAGRRLASGRRARRQARSSWITRAWVTAASVRRVVAALVREGQPAVVQPEGVQQRRVQVGDADDLLDGRVAEVVGRPVDVAAS